MNICDHYVCFALDKTSLKFFGFSEFLTGLALMVLAWTLADVRYRFRVSTAALPLREATFAMVLLVGVLTLLTDVWRAQEWLVPSGQMFSPATWQALLGAAFLFTFLIWAWYAFIKPPVYGFGNAKRFANVLYRIILKGDPTELAIVADELNRSTKALIKHAPGREARQRLSVEAKNWIFAQWRMPQGYAHDLLLLIADKRFCRAIVRSSPGTALGIFRELEATKKFDVAISLFARNIVNEALANSDSFLFHEVEGYESGLLGLTKPLSQAMSPLATQNPSLVAGSKSRTSEA